MGDSGSPSIEISFPCLWKINWPHPTPQYGQMDRVTCADSVFGASCFVRELMTSRLVPRDFPRICCSRGHFFNNIGSCLPPRTRHYQVSIVLHQVSIVLPLRVY